MSLKIPSIFSVVDKFTGPVDKMTKAMDKFGSAGGEAAARVERRMRKVSDASFDVAKKAGTAGLAIMAPLALAVRESVKFEEKMSNVATLLDTTQESMQDMSNNVLDLATKMPVSIDDLASSLYDIRSAGISAKDSMMALEFSAKLGTAGLATTAEATNLMTSAMNAFASEGKSAEEIADILFKTVKAGKTNVSQIAQAFGASAPVIQAAGVTLADFQAATAALTTVGTPASQAQNQLRAAITALSKPSKDMEAIFAKLGVKTVPEMIKKYGSMGNAFQAINAQGAKLNINMAKAWSSTEALASVTALTGATNEAYVKTLEDMTQGTNALNEAFQKQSATGKAALQLAQNNLQAVAITIGAELLPVVVKLLQKLMPVIKSVKTWVKENPKLAKTVILGVAALGALLLVISALATIVGVFAKGIMLITTVSKLWTVATMVLNAALWANPIVWIIAAIIALIAVVIAIIKYWDEWGASLTLLMGPLGMLISLIVTIGKHWDKIKQAFKEGGILEGIKAIGKAILDSILYPIQQALGLIGKFTGIEMFSNAASGLEQFRLDALGVEAPAPVERINPEQERASRNQGQQGRVDLFVNDNQNRVRAESQTDWIGIKTTPTYGFSGS